MKPSDLQTVTPIMSPVAVPIPPNTLKDIAADVEDLELRYNPVGASASQSFEVEYRLLGRGLPMPYPLDDQEDT